MEIWTFPSLDELPPGRQRTDTFLVNETYRARLNGFLRKEVQAGHQCYVVCPSVEEGGDGIGKAAQVWAETLRQRVFPDLQVGLLHGRMKGPEKEAAMAEFARERRRSWWQPPSLKWGWTCPTLR